MTAGQAWLWGEGLGGRGGEGRLSLSLCPAEAAPGAAMAEDVWGDGCHHRAAGATESLVMPPCAREGRAAGRTTAQGWGLQLGQRCGRKAE